MKVFRRSSWTARDESPTIDVVREYLEHSSYNLENLFVLLQATFPFTQTKELYSLIQEVLKKECTSYIACYRLKKSVGVMTENHWIIHRRLNPDARNMKEF